MKIASTIVRWSVPNDLYDRLKAEAAKQINMPVATYALNVLNDVVPRRPEGARGGKPYPTSNEVLYRGEPK